MTGKTDFFDKYKKRSKNFSITTNFLTSSLNNFVNKLSYYL